MRMSEKRKMALHSCIYEIIKDARIEIAHRLNTGEMAMLCQEDVDQLLSNLDSRIWSQITHRSILNIKQ